MFNIAFDSKNHLVDDIFWNKFIKKKILIKAYKIFKEKINSVKWNYYEDNIWSILIHKYAKSMICIKKVIYNYKFNNKNSIMHNFGNLLELKNLIYRGEMLIKIFNKKNEEKFIISGILRTIKIVKSRHFLSLLNNNLDIKNKLL